MLSNDIMSVARTLELLADGVVTPPSPRFFKTIAGVVKSHAEAARQLELATVPTRYRVTDADLMEGKVAMFKPRDGGAP